jgi:predicted Ser/Thr protein kinase
LTNENDLLNRTFETSISSFFIRKKLGKGKSGYSYLAEFGNHHYVLKLMHYEPCHYYSFGANNKVDLEVNAYNRLKECNILLPELLVYDAEKNYLVKEYIEGVAASELIASNKINESIIKQLFKMYRLAKKAGLNIDYFPSNFIIRDQQLFYIDYECNPYSPEWDLPNWGIYYWANTEGFREYLSTGDILFINESPETGKPLKKPFEEEVSAWIKKYE